MGQTATGQIAVTEDGHRQGVVDLADTQIAQHAMLLGDVKQQPVVHDFTLLQHDQPVGQPQNLAQGLTGVQNRQAQFILQAFQNLQQLHSVAVADSGKGFVQ